MNNKIILGVLSFFLLVSIGVNTYQHFEKSNKTIQDKLNTELKDANDLVAKQEEAIKTKEQEINDLTQKLNERKITFYDLEIEKTYIIGEEIPKGTYAFYYGQNTNENTGGSFKAVNSVGNCTKQIIKINGYGTGFFRYVAYISVDDGASIETHGRLDFSRLVLINEDIASNEADSCTDPVASGDW